MEQSPFFTEQSVEERENQTFGRETKLSRFIKSITPSLFKQMEAYLNQTQRQYQLSKKQPHKIPLYEDIAAIHTIKKEQKDIFLIKNKLRKTIEYIAKGFGRKYMTVDERLKKKLCQLTPQQLSFLIKNRRDITFKGNSKVLNTDGWPRDLVRSKSLNIRIKPTGHDRGLELNSDQEKRQIKKQETKSVKIQEKKEALGSEGGNGTAIDRKNKVEKQQQEQLVESEYWFRNKLIMKRDQCQKKVQKSQKMPESVSVNQESKNNEPQLLKEEDRGQQQAVIDNKQEAVIDNKQEAVVKEKDQREQMIEGMIRQWQNSCLQKYTIADEQNIQMTFMGIYPDDRSYLLWNIDALSSIFQFVNMKLGINPNEPLEVQTQLYEYQLNCLKPKEVSQNYRQAQQDELVDLDSWEKITNDQNYQHSRANQIPFTTNTNQQTKLNQIKKDQDEDQNWMDRPSNQQILHQAMLNRLKDHSKKDKTQKVSDYALLKQNTLQSNQAGQVSIDENNKSQLIIDKTGEQEPSRRKNRAMQLLRDPQFTIDIDQHTQDAKQKMRKLYSYSRRIKGPSPMERRTWFCDNEDLYRLYESDPKKYEHLKWTKREDSLLISANQNIKRCQQEFLQLIKYKRSMNYVLERIEYLAILISKQLGEFIDDYKK